MRKYFITSLFFILLFSACTQQPQTTSKKSIDYVDPFIGTGGHGHTYPGATLPFGMVQLSPDNGTSGWDWCSGYNYADDTIAGFGHTHLSGTGIGDLADIIVLPSTKRYIAAPDETNRQVIKHYHSFLDHGKEKASPGYYFIEMDDSTQVHLTCTERVGLHRYYFPKNQVARVIIDLGYAQNWDSTVETYFEIVNQNTLVGYRYSKGWAEDQKVFFAIKFSYPFGTFGILEKGRESYLLDTITGKDMIGYAEFYNTDSLMLKVGLSSASIAGALDNIQSEVKGWDFWALKKRAEAKWAAELGKIKVEAQNEQQATIFYTALYHSMLAPNLFSDLNGQYHYNNGKVHTATGFDMYTVFSLWDTFRAAHPLFTIMHPGRVNDMIKSMLAHYDQTGLLPVWVLQGNETNCMIGYHSIPVIADAIQKGIGDFNIEKAYKTMKTSAMQDTLGLKQYKELGYIPFEEENQAVSKTLEYAYDDWCISMIAGKLGKTEEADYFRNRAMNYQNTFDPESKFMRGKDRNGKWREDFDPLFSNHFNADFTEGNAWQFLWFAPQDVQGLIDLVGGKEAFATKLDSLFSIKAPVKGEHSSPDISGLIGQYAHGNEPSHHVAYLYNYAGQPWKTQEMTHRIVNELYTDQPDGLCGNEDCGQMSAWYVFSALGFYPVNPAEGIYVIGSPAFPKAEVSINDSTSFVVEAKNVSEINIYIQSAMLNGKALDRSYITHKEIMAGGNLIFEMGPKPNKDLWVDEKAYPPSMIKPE
ncbi:MAG: GH92 family glycosyl hydrolase [Bacteroidales bacterium]|nr:GH92 family glycosyl hydrolase [Bacteroidales bacterium]MCF8456384.1 GH92 family glycosyl hydrolase [Bacteroidales bacterium]